MQLDFILSRVVFFIEKRHFLKELLYKKEVFYSMRYKFKKRIEKMKKSFGIVLATVACLFATVCPIMATTLEVEDTPIGPKLTIYKISEYKDKDNQDIPIEGVTFKVYSDEDCSDSSLLATGTTNTSGIINFDFEMEEKGKYYIKETAVPSDNSYKLDETVHSLVLNYYIPATKSCQYTYDGTVYTETNQGTNINLSDTSSDWSEMKFTLTLTNSPNNKPFYEELPMTGGQLAALLGVGVVLVVCIATIVLKKKNEDDE